MKGPVCRLPNAGFSDPGRSALQKASRRRSNWTQASGHFSSTNFLGMSGRARTHASSFCRVGAHPLPMGYIRPLCWLHPDKMAVLHSATLGSPPRANPAQTLLASVSACCINPCSFIMVADVCSSEGGSSFFVIGAPASSSL